MRRQNCRGISGSGNAQTVDLGTFPAVCDNDILDAAEYPPAISVIA
jgi:hypothetical protein